MFIVQHFQGTKTFKINTYNSTFVMKFDIIAYPFFNHFSRVVDGYDSTRPATPSTTTKKSNNCHKYG